MMKQMILGAAAVIGVMAAGVAQADSVADGWMGQGYAKDGIYVRGQGGWTGLDDNNFNTPAPVETKYKDGWNAGGAIGMKNGPLRYELEGAHYNSDVKA